MWLVLTYFNLHSGSSKVDDVSEITNMGFQFCLNGTYVIVEWNEDSMCTIIKFQSDPDDGDIDYDIREISYSELNEMIN